MELVDPRDILKDFFAGMDLSAFPALARSIGYWLLRSGLSPSTDIISVYSDEELAEEESEIWLENF
jgi:hypothetical protein